MDPCENARHDHAKPQGPSHMSMHEAWLRLRLITADNLPLPARHRHETLRTQNEEKSSLIAEYVRRRPALPRPVKAGIGLIALLAAVIGGFVWRKRRRK